MNMVMTNIFHAINQHDPELDDLELDDPDLDENQDGVNHLDDLELEEVKTKMIIIPL